VSGPDDFALAVSPEGWTLGRFPALDAVSGVAHAVSTRHGPRLAADAADPETVAGMRALAGGLGLRGVAWCRQVHGGVVRWISAAGPQGEGDALVTMVPGLGVLGRSADCPLILLAGSTTRSASGRAVGLAHASWRSTVAGIAGRTVAVMQERCGVDPGTLAAAICPSAGPCCYEVGEEVRTIALDRLDPRFAPCFAEREGRLFLDLWRANALQLEAAGVPAGRIHACGVCTICRNDLFPSHRAEQGRAARFAALVGLP
jgi:YfiH family protein